MKKKSSSHFLQVLFKIFVKSISVKFRKIDFTKKIEMFLFTFLVHCVWWWGCCYRPILLLAPNQKGGRFIRESWETKVILFCFGLRHQQGKKTTKLRAGMSVARPPRHGNDRPTGMVWWEPRHHFQKNTFYVAQIILRETPNLSLKTTIHLPILICKCCIQE